MDTFEEVGIRKPATMTAEAPAPTHVRCKSAAWKWLTRCKVYKVLGRTPTGGVDVLDDIGFMSSMSAGEWEPVEALERNAAKRSRPAHVRCMETERKWFTPGKVYAVIRWTIDGSPVVAACDGVPTPMREWGPSEDPERNAVKAADPAPAYVRCKSVARKWFTRCKVYRVLGRTPIGGVDVLNDTGFMSSMSAGEWEPVPTPQEGYTSWD